ncbi:MAG: hypothetical protein G01um101413_626 [Parcubacteria group bacterium Gr01-1014_13]|nr:MAG: hypothetical protein G01um101413_626 [Parcubacteria group bacterium Gr01-1014_13]
MREISLVLGILVASVSFVIIYSAEEIGMFFLLPVAGSIFTLIILTTVGDVKVSWEKAFFLSFIVIPIFFALLVIIAPYFA